MCIPPYISAIFFKGKQFFSDILFASLNSVTTSVVRPVGVTGTLLGPGQSIQKVEPIPLILLPYSLSSLIWKRGSFTPELKKSFPVAGWPNLHLNLDLL